LALLLKLWRASFIRHPFIANSTWRFRYVRLALVLITVISILMSPSSYFEQMYMASILKFDPLNRISLNWVSLFGSVCGGVFTFMTFALRDWKFKTMTMIAFSLMVLYLLCMYFMIDYNVPIESMYLPVFLRSAGMIIIPVTFLTTIFRTIPFQQFFQALNIVTLMTTCCGPLLGVALLTKWFKISMRANELFLMADLDLANPITSHFSAESLFGHMQQQSMIIGMKEIYGWFCIAGIFCLMAFFFRESSFCPKFLGPKSNIV
jgi:MFS transporter, DHA2 family, multidrug resistance protein